MYSLFLSSFPKYFFHMYQVVRNLQELYGNTYTLRNVILTGTHTHATPGGYLVDFVLDVSILGFSRETFDAYVTGITNVSYIASYILKSWAYFLFRDHF